MERFLGGGGDALIEGDRVRFLFGAGAEGFVVDGREAEGPLVKESPDFAEGLDGVPLEPDAEGLSEAAFAVALRELEEAFVCKPLGLEGGTEVDDFGVDVPFD